MSIVFRKLFNIKIDRSILKHFRCSSTSVIQSDNIVTSGLSDIVIPNQSIHEYIYEKTENFSSFIATECAITGRKYTFLDIREKSKNLSRALIKKLKLNPGDVVAIYSNNIPEFPISVLGILEAGLTCTTLNSVFTEDEVFKQLFDCRAKAIITIPELENTVNKVNARLKNKLPILTIKTQENQSICRNSINFTEFCENIIELPNEQIDSQNDAIMLYSSGTTGLPKGVLLTHRNIVSNLSQCNHPDVQMFDQLPKGNEQNVVPCIIPMFHVYGFVVNTLLGISNGAKLLTLPKFSPDTFIAMLEKYDVNYIFAAPPLVTFLNNYNEVKSEHLRALKLLTSGAAPLSETDVQKFKDKFGCHISAVQAYGLTETGPIVSFTTKQIKHDAKIKSAGSSGRIVPNTLAKIVSVNDDTAKALGVNETGELLVKGPQVMKGYFNRPEETSNAFHDGWFKTGDIASYNEDGCIFIKDRLKELIKVKGFQVAPAELEAVLRQHPSVAEAAVIGIPHPNDGEVPRAYIVPKKKIDLNELDAYVTQKVAPYKRLKGGIQIVDSVPKNPSGKLLRKHLKVQFEKENR